ncbi:hypothetical protein AB3N04_04825 [Alkalihalophilus sp. As8PL]|uniref:Pyrrolo-quinoline quinone n=1 Tax=Alkalihalophilus sp. As8PL TaxID=3237103 RepID=A0AB39BUP3_9BACI
MRWRPLLISVFILALLAGCSQITFVNERVAADEKLIVHNHGQKQKDQREKLLPIKLPYEEIAIDKTDLTHLTYDLNGEVDFDSALFPETYTDIPGILTFRGNHSRTSPSYGNVTLSSSTLDIAWSFRTGTHHKWGGGAGWTGQPSIVKWEPDVRRIMNIHDHFKEQEDFTEVIYGSLDGSVYFADLYSGELTRSPIKVGGPIKGSVAIDPRGYPLLYVGQGIPESDIGYRIFSLIDGSELHFIEGADPWAYRAWGAFDGSALINRKSDQLVVGGENGLFYHANLNTKFNVQEKTISVDPDIMKARYNVQGNHYQGIENSVAIYKNIAYFADNGGSVLAIDLADHKPLFALEPTDDTDATIVVEAEDNHPFLYTGTEVDQQGSFGNCLIRKIDGLSGEIIWSKEYPAYSLSAVNGGMLATPVVGKEEIEHLVIFTIARYETLHGGLMIAVNKKTGEEEWRLNMDHYAWSSPVDVYTEDGKAMLIQADSAGNMHLIEGSTGKVKDVVNLGSNIEATPAVYENYIVVASRGGLVFGVELK